MELTNKEQDKLEMINKFVYENNVSNAFLVQLIEVAGKFLNLKTIPDYVKENDISYNGVKNHRHIETIFNVKFVIDND